MPVVAVLGLRQVGMTMLARRIAAGRRGDVHWSDLGLPSSRARLDDPETALSALRGLVAIGEVQRRPDIFRVLRAPVGR